MDWGLERMRSALSVLGDPHLGYRCLHVGGTNGKGSVASSWASILRAEGARTGLYTSPHLCSFRERIHRCDGEPVPDAPSARHGRGGSAPWRAELSACRSSRPRRCWRWSIFAEEQVDIGLHRGRTWGTARRDQRDRTRGHRHHQRGPGPPGLSRGFTLEEIAREKAGIIKPGVPVVTAEGRSRRAARCCEDRAARGGSAPFHIGSIPWRDIAESSSRNDRGTRFGSVRTAGGGLLDLAHTAPRRPPGGQRGARRPSARAASASARFAGCRCRRGGCGGACGRAGWTGAPGGRASALHLRCGAQPWPRIGGARAASLADLAPPRPLVVLAGILGDKDWSAACCRRSSISPTGWSSPFPHPHRPERNWDPARGGGPGEGGRRSVTIEVRGRDV